LWADLLTVLPQILSEDWSQFHACAVEHVRALFADNAVTIQVRAQVSHALWNGIGCHGVLPLAVVAVYGSVKARPVPRLSFELLAPRPFPRFIG
jgi:hypothetical protein